MYTILTNRRDDKDRDEGFTLIELMVVVLIIAILLAIAIPTFLGAQSKAKDRGAQSSAKNALTAAKTIYADTGEYSGATQTALLAIEPNLKFVEAPSDKPQNVSVVTAVAAAGAAAGDPLVVEAKVWYAAVLSESDTCYYIRDSIDPNDALLTGTSYAKFADSVTCQAGDTPQGSVAYTVDGWD